MVDHWCGWLGRDGVERRRYACHNSDLLRTFVAEEVNAFRSVTRHAARVAVGGR